VIAGETSGTGRPIPDRSPRLCVAPLNRAEAGLRDAQRLGNNFRTRLTAGAALALAISAHSSKHHQALAHEQTGPCWRSAPPRPSDPQGGVGQRRVRAHASPRFEKPRNASYQGVQPAVASGKRERPSPAQLRDRHRRGTTPFNGEHSPAAGARDWFARRAIMPRWPARRSLLAAGRGSAARLDWRHSDRPGRSRSAPRHTIASAQSRASTSLAVSAAASAGIASGLLTRGRRCREGRLSVILFRCSPWASTRWRARADGSERKPLPHAEPGPSPNQQTSCTTPFVRAKPLLPSALEADGDKYKPLDSVRLPSQIHHVLLPRRHHHPQPPTRTAEPRTGPLPRPTAGNQLSI